MSEIPDFIKKAYHTTDASIVLVNKTIDGKIIYKSKPYYKKVGGCTVFICDNNHIIERLDGIAAMVFWAKL